jgi:hypothetical protein
MLRHDFFFALFSVSVVSWRAERELGVATFENSGRGTQIPRTSPLTSSPALRSDLFNGQKSFRQIVGERGEFGSAGGGGFELLFFPDEVVVPVESNSRAEVSVDEVRRLGENCKSVWDDWG